MAYEFRIIETTMAPVYLSEMKFHRMDYKASRKFYIAQYRKTSCWLLSWLLATDWTDIKYNAEEYANCNNVSIALKPYKYPCLYEKLGTILPSYEAAMQLLAAFKKKIHYNGDTKKPSDTVVYYEGHKKPEECVKSPNEIMAEYDSLIGKKRR